MSKLKKGIAHGLGSTLQLVGAFYFVGSIAIFMLGRLNAIGYVAINAGISMIAFIIGWKLQKISKSIDADG